jgi:hypothetical protein
MISAEGKGDFNATKRWLDKMKRGLSSTDGLATYGEMGVRALQSATPVESGQTRSAWRYRIVSDRNGPRIEWYNTHDGGGVSVAVLIQFGHGTGTGGYVQGRDFINPAMRPIFDRIANEVGKKVR